MTGPVPCGKMRGQANREPVRLQVHLFQQCNILCPAVVAVAGDVPCITVPCFARRMAEGIPDGQSPTILLHCALDLIGCGCRAQTKFSGNDIVYSSVFCRLLFLHKHQKRCSASALHLRKCYFTLSRCRAQYRGQCIWKESDRLTRLSENAMTIFFFSCHLRRCVTPFPEKRASP